MISKTTFSSAIFAVAYGISLQSKKPS